MDTSYTLRPASPEDIEALVAIDAINPAPWSERQFTGAIDDVSSGAKTVLVAHGAERVDGFIVYSQVLDEASVHNIAVRPARQRQGLGRELLDQALQCMKGAGASRCLLEVRRSKAAAQRLYESAGFERDGERKDYYPGANGRENALLMSRKL